MSTTFPKFEHGPITFTAEEAVTGGQLVEAGTKPRTVKPAAADSAKVVGVAIQDASPDGPTKATAVACLPAQVQVKISGAAVGDLVKAAANGEAAKATPGTDTQEKIVGRVIETVGEDFASIRLYV